VLLRGQAQPQPSLWHARSALELGADVGQQMAFNNLVNTERAQLEAMRPRVALA